MKRSLVVGVLLLLGLMLVAAASVGCAPPTATPVTASPTVPPPTPTTPPAAPTPTEAPEGPSGSLIIALGLEPTNLDPQKEDLTTVWWVTDNIYEFLAFPNKETMEMEPQLAVSWERIDPTTMRFKLREGVMFHNGEPFNAEAVVYSVNRMLDPETQSEFTGFIATIVGAQAVDEYTVDIKTDGPDPILIRRVGWIAMVPPEHAKDRDTFLVEPVGTGPYKFVEWLTGQRVVLTANEDYWGEMPSIKDVTYRIIPEASTRALAVAAGEVDFTPELPPEFVDQVPKVVSAHGLNNEWLRMNPQRPPTDDLRVRQAIAYAIDKEAIVEEIFDGFAAVPQGQLNTPNHLGYNPNIKAYPYDPEKAKELLADYGQPVSVELLLESTGYFPQGLKMNDAMISFLQDVGIDVQPIYREFGPWLEGLFVEPGEEARDHPHLVLTNHDNPLMDYDRTLTTIFHTGGRQSVYSDENLDKIIDEQRSELDVETRVKLTQEALQFMHDQAWHVPLANYDDIYGIGAHVEWTPRPDWKIILSEIRLTQ